MRRGEARVECPANHVADHLAREHNEHDREKNEGPCEPHVGEVGRPPLIRCRRDNLCPAIRILLPGHRVRLRDNPWSTASRRGAERRLQDALHALAIRAIGPGPQLARDTPMAVPWEPPLHPRHGRPKVGIGLGGEAIGPEMIIDRPLLVARAAMSPLSSRSSSVVSCPTFCSSAARCCAVSTDSSSPKSASESSPRGTSLDSRAPSSDRRRPWYGGLHPRGMPRRPRP